MHKPNGKPEIATIVAVTRKSEGVATITKVYTPEKWRGHGCAERLVRHVCIEYVLAAVIFHHDTNFFLNRLLEKYKQIVLYIDVENRANVVYDRMGFQGLSKGSVSERWIETGFERKHQ